MTPIKTLIRLLPLFALPVCASATAEEQDQRFYVAPLYSHIFEDSNRATENGSGFTLAIGKRVSERIELEVLATQVRYDEDDRPGSGLPCSLLGTCPPIPGGTYKSTTLGGGANIFFSPASQGAYIHLDAAFGSDSRFLYDGGLGYRWMLGDRWGIRAEALYHSDDGDFTETLVNIGLHAYLGKKPVPPAPEPVQVVPVVAEPEPAPLPPPPCGMPESGQPVDFAGCKTGDVIVLRGVHFETAEATLTADATALLDTVATALVAKPDIHVEIGGHTDDQGADSYNQTLSENRAQSVKDYLAAHGVEAERLHAAGFGESQPVDSNETEEGRALNRRVELKVIDASAVPTAALAVEVDANADAAVGDAGTEAIVSDTGSTDAVIAPEQETTSTDAAVEATNAVPAEGESISNGDNATPPAATDANATQDSAATEAVDATTPENSTATETSNTTTAEGSTETEATSATTAEGATAIEASEATATEDSSTAPAETTVTP